MLFLNAVFYQYGTICGGFDTYRTYWHGESIEMIHKHTKWTRGGSLCDKNEWEMYEQYLINVDIVVCLPSWKKYRPVSNARNVTFARLLTETENTKNIIPFVCGYQAPDPIDEDSICFRLSCPEDIEDDSYCIGELETIFRQRLIDIDRYTNRFQPMFDRPDGEWVVDINQENAITIVKYFLTVETQRMLKEKNCYGGEIDGVYSFRTKEALRKFQMLKLLPADGIPNRETWQILRQEA